ncbi:MAG: hypothetical protein KAH93_05870 [Candidatus Aenigmarchaeota archaeon]|nr:hypothetical protein [Candidatus Aenigmarchaeota archaeon]
MFHDLVSGGDYEEESTYIPSVSSVWIENRERMYSELRILKNTIESDLHPLKEIREVKSDVGYIFLSDDVKNLNAVVSGMGKLSNDLLSSMSGSCDTEKLSYTELFKDVFTFYKGLYEIVEKELSDYYDEKLPQELFAYYHSFLGYSKNRVSYVPKNQIVFECEERNCNQLEFMNYVRHAFGDITDIMYSDLEKMKSSFGNIVEEMNSAYPDVMIMPDSDGLDMPKSPLKHDLSLSSVFVHPLYLMRGRHPRENNA